MVEDPHKKWGRMIGSLYLEKNEKPVHIWENVDYMRNNGLLALTNIKLVFFKKMGGSNFQPYLRINLEEIKDIAFKTFFSIIHKCSVTVTLENNVFVFYGRNRNTLESLRNIVFENINFRKEEIETLQKKKKNIKVLMDFAFLQDYMKKGGLLLPSIRCSQCGTPIELPESGKNALCKNCGNFVRAQDLFEKIKDLIG